MQTQQQIQQPNKPQGQQQKHKGFSRKQRIIATVIAAIVVAIVIITAQVLSILSLIPGVWANILTTVVGTLGVLFTFFALLPIFFPPDDPKSSTTPGSAPTPPATPQSPSTLPAVQPTPTGHTATSNPTANTPTLVSSTGNATQPAQPTGSSTKDFLISYADTDLIWAEWIASQLETAGYLTVLRAWDFEAGANFVLEMDEATKAAKRTIVVLSPDYLKSFEQHPEWAVAFRKDPTGKERKLVPVYVRDCKDQLTGFLGSIVAIDLVGKIAGDEAAARELLLSSVRPGGRRPKTPPTFPGQVQA